jgi:hypothetical protein
LINIQTGVDSVKVAQPIPSERGDSISTSTLQISHQRKIRNEQAKLDSSPLAEWHDVDRSIENGIVREITYNEAKPIIERYEWLGTMPAIVFHCFGIFFDNVCGGVAVFGVEYTENLGVWDKYGYTGKIICLARWACVHWAHEHTGSKLIRVSMRMLPERFKVITCTVDATAGEIGTIYQACGFDFVGQMSKGGNRASIITADGKHLSNRQAYQLYGTRSIKKLRDMGHTVVSVPRKARYFGFAGTKKEQREHRKAIEHLIKPYPKRSLC